MPRFHAEAMLFCLAWTALAISAAVTVSVWMGILFSAGIAVILMPLSAMIVSRTENMAVERQARWGLLVLAALSLSLYLWLS